MKSPFNFLAAAALALASLHAWGGEFGVSPIRVDLDRGTRSAVVTVSNDGDAPLDFQIRATAWTQDAAGRDRYEPTGDLVFFPQQLRIPPRENRVVRLGYRNPALQIEKAYRLYIEEQAPRNESTSDRPAASVAVAVRFGVPVFLRPPSVEEKGEVTDLALEGGKLGATVRNTGPVHFRINSVHLEGLGADGSTTFEQTLDGWYLLAGAERRYAAAFPPEACRRTARLRVEAVSDRLRLRSELPASASLCSAP